MPDYTQKKHFQHDEPARLGILLTNLGTPEAPTPKAVRKFLREFLSDPRVVEIPRLLWMLILHGFILPTRPRKSAHAYQQIWTKDGSPLLTISRAQTLALQTKLSAQYRDSVIIALGMRYGQPSIEQAMSELRDAGAQRLLVLPLYPQYSATTTASTMDAVANVLRGWRWLPELRYIQHYPDHSGYIKSLTNSIQDYWQQNSKGDHLLLSFHGIPKRNLLAGDPYYCECQKTGRLLLESLGNPSASSITFQSRLGRAEWLQPYTDQTLIELAQQGVKNIDVVCPGFPADCLETLEEIALQNGELFKSKGGKKLNYIPALNDRPDHIQALYELIQQHTQGWPETDATAKLNDSDQARAKRAITLGAKL